MLTQYMGLKRQGHDNPTLNYLFSQNIIIHYSKNPKTKLMV